MLSRAPSPCCEPGVCLARSLLSAAALASAVALAVALAVRAPAAAQDPAPDRARRVVLFAEDPLPGRTARLRRLRQWARDGVSTVRWEAEVDALRTASRAAAGTALERTVEDFGGRVVRAFWSFAGAEVETDPDRIDGLVDRLETLPAIDRVSDGAAGRAHIGTSTNAQNHAADCVQSVPGWDGSGVALALIDSGIDIDCGGRGTPHPAFNYASMTEASRILAAFGIRDADDAEDRTGHGTAVAGVAVATDWMATAGGASDSGFAPGAFVVSYKITEEFSDLYDPGDLCAAVDAILRDRVRYDIRVANFSFGGRPNPDDAGQQALDRLATIGDILVVSSAGNDGTLPNPTVTSNGHTNGITVAAVHPDSHRVWESSTPGPLLGDFRRLWPDLAAVGVGLITPAPDSADGTSSPLNGTSFAAPAVAGTALVLRSHRPTLSVMDTKALILNSVADISAQNPGLNHYHYGLGLLRTDLAVRAVVEGDLHRGSVSRTSQESSVQVKVDQGTTYAATVVWMRYDLGSRQWDDLDLEVHDTDGRLLARAQSPRNLYERVVFTARQTGSYTLRVRAASLVQETAEWSLAFGIERGDGRQRGEYATFRAGCRGSGPDPGQGLELPASTRTRWGNFRTTLPIGSQPARLMQAFLARDIPPNTVFDKIFLRRDESHFGVPTFDIDLDVWAGHTRRHPAGLRLDFGGNPDAPMTRVLAARRLSMPGTADLPDHPGVYDYVLPLDRPFVAAGGGSGRNLLLDFRLRGNSEGDAPFGLFVDAEIDPFELGVIFDLGDPDAARGCGEPWGLLVSLVSGQSGGIPTLIADRMPQLGVPLDVVLRHAPEKGAAALIHGASITSWEHLRLPLVLDPYGAPGCELLVRPDVLLPVPVDAAGQGRYRYTLPGLPELSGEEFHNQFLVLDPAANPLGVTVSNGGTGRVGG